MEKVLFVLSINVCLISVFVKSAYHVQYFPQEKTWFEAQRICKNLKGWLTLHKNNDIGCNHVTGIIRTKGSTFWTGEYSTKSHWISKIGCIELLEQTNVSLIPTLTKCLENCRMRQINVELLGHIENRCVCISNTSSRKEDVIQQCSISSKNRFWMYSVTKNENLTGSGDCVFVDCQHKPWPVVYAAACKDERRPFCNGSVKLNWTSSQELCKDQIPGNLSEICKKMQTDKKEVWLHMHRVVLRNDVIHNVFRKENDVTQCESFHCYHQNGVGAVPANNPCKNKTNGFFCTLSSAYNETTDISNTTHNSAPYYFQSTKVHGSLQQTSNAYKITGTKSLTTIINSSTMFQTATSIVVKLNDNMNFTEISEVAATSDIGLIVGGVFGVLSIIGVIALVVIIKLRGKAATKRQTMEPYEMSKDNSAIDEDTQRQKTSNDETANTQYEEDWAHAGRFFAEKIMETALVNSHDRKNLNDVYAVVMKDNMTSPLQGGQDSEIASHEAIDSEYDMLNITPQFLRDNTENNLYDSSLADRCESDPTYNTATDMIHSRQNNEDVYDRI